MYESSPCPSSEINDKDQSGHDSPVAFSNYVPIEVIMKDGFFLAYLFYDPLAKAVIGV
jgi:hypothetical protein